MLTNITVYQVISTRTPEHMEAYLTVYTWQGARVFSGHGSPWFFSTKHSRFPTTDSIIQVLSFCCLKTFVNGTFILSRWLLWTSLNLALFSPFVSFVIHSNILSLLNLRRFIRHLSTRLFPFPFKYLYVKILWNASQNMLVFIPSETQKQESHWDFFEVLAKTGCKAWHL